ncbi:MAG: outer membrane beta-barrel protein [Candidatus Kapabacteria bacterium]|nr:outer membrane beta-barrel protein [Candidatus Kapabacteria bacterium]
MKKILLTIFVLALCFVNADAQSLNYKFSGYVDTYYATDNDGNFEALSTGMRPFSYINKQKDQFRLNTAQVQGVFNYDNRVRGTIALHTGDLVQTGWTDLGTAYPLIQQANAGFMAFNNFWIDGGYFLTHIGGEVLLPKDNWLSSHSLVTFYEPFYQAGVRFSYETPKFTAQLHLLNGNGIFEDNNYNKTVGIFLSYNLSNAIKIAYANTLGNEVADRPENARLLMFHNFNFYFNASEKFRVKAQIDYASLAEKEVGSQKIEAQSFMGISAQAQYSFTDKYAASLRASYISSDKSLFGAAESGTEIALGLQYKPAEMLYCRIEGRMLGFDDKYKPFLVDNKAESSRMELMLNIGVVLE